MAAFLLFAILIAAGQTPTPKVHSEMLVSTEWLGAHLHDRNLVVICIANDPESYLDGHIPGTRLILLHEISVTRNEIPNELPDAQKLKEVFEKAGVSANSRIILYGERSGVLAARAYYTLDFMGLGAQASLLDGGLEKWKKEKRTVTAEEPAVQRGNITLRLQSGLVVEHDAMKNLVMQAKLRRQVLLDARPFDEFTGEKLSEEVEKPGHIPGAASLYWGNLIESPANPVLLPPDVLRKKFEQAGVRPGRSVVTYCRSGVQSSFDYFVAKYLGYEVSMYDASYFAWAHEDLPVETSK